MQVLTAPGSEQGTSRQEGSSGLLTVFWALPPRSSSFGSELRLRVAMEIWGLKLEKTRMSAHPLPDRNQETQIQLSCRASGRPLLSMNCYFPRWVGELSLSEAQDTKGSSLRS